jgi:ABC-2 type transport system ATP-binding protein
MPDPVLEVADVRKRFGPIVALDGVSLRVEAGEVFGLIGPNGAGKTTLLSIAAGLSRADAGTVTLFGRPFSRDSRDQRHLVGIGTQDLSIYPDLTARENLRFFGRLYGLGGKPLEARVDEVLAAVGLSDRADGRAGTFSGGMKRRLNLAAAIVHGPKVLFLDEPTAGVDPQSRNNILEQVHALNAAGMTVIYTSHYMEEVQALCTRIAILDHGALRACDTLPNLLKRLDATIRVTVAQTPNDFAQRLAVLPGVKKVTHGEPDPAKATGAFPSSVGRTDAARSATGVDSSPFTFELVVDDVGPVLAKVASLCAEVGAPLTAATTTEPTLERVFLNLTGRGLRD